MLVNPQVCVWLIRQFHFVPRGNIGITLCTAFLYYFTKTSPGEYDPAEIHNAGQLRRHMVWSEFVDEIDSKHFHDISKDQAPTDSDYLSLLRYLSFFSFR